MTTECESVVSPSLGTENLPHPLSLPSNTMRSAAHTQSGISYEGRVSLISPMNTYEAALRMETPSNQFLPPNLHSPPFSSPRGYGFINPDQFGFSFSEDNRRPMFHLQPQSHSTPGSSRDFDLYNHYQSERANEGNVQIKREVVDPDYQRYDLTNNYSENLQPGVFNNVESKDPKETFAQESETHEKLQNPHHEAVKEASDSTLLSAEHHLNREFITNGNSRSPQPLSPSAFPENDESGPCSAESDCPDPRDAAEIQASLMNTSFDGSQEIFHHGENSKSLKCQFCPYSTDSKSQFSSHMNCHFDHKCTKCEFTTQTTDQIKEHLQEEHGLTIEDTEEFESTRVPRVNSQGKVKTFKCKQCDYIAITKSDFWKHAKTHIKSEKLLSCSKCPFVTEYKHHLEYHLRNHFGSKPYKCNKCTYSCVNKSMLNSHMKSHSNIYQYRCSDCTYATKYCHSLKLHLRKYGHTPAMVLNPDGSPNPVPIIDIYGTRRGPKLKKDENGMPILPPQYQLQAQFVKAHMEVTGSIPPAPIVPPEKTINKAGSARNLSLPPTAFPNPFTFPPNPQNYASFIPHEFKEVPRQMRKPSGEKPSPNNSLEKEESLNASKSPEVEDSLKCDLCNFSTESKDILSHHMLLHAKEEEAAADTIESLSVPAKENSDDKSRHVQKEANLVSNSFTKEEIPPTQVIPPTLPSTQNTLQEYFARAMNPLIYSPMISGQNFIHPAIDLQQQLQRLFYQSSKRDYSVAEKNLTLSPIKLNSNQNESVLDLSKDQTLHESDSIQHHSSTASPPFLTSSSIPEVSTPPSKSRRKGRAYKLERIALRLSGSGEEGESSCNEGGPEIQKEQEEKRSKGTSEVPPLLPLDLPESKSRPTNAKMKWGEAHQCQYCDIAFKDVVMYTMHMGYHGYKDPFTCNMCGFDAVDKLSFFLHIGRSSHL